MKRQQILLSILIANLISTGLHYTENAIFVSQYPGPDWFTTSGIFATVALMTPVGLLGYWLYTKGQHFWSDLVLCIYSLTSISSPGHYLYPGAMSMSAKMHSLIWLDAIAGYSLLIFVFWSAAIWKEWQLKDSQNRSE
ncbi:hypothetical protein [Microseira sp. BLCC-F43]|jgi:hypothetical protein|uniref:hypothetical protein n=1 Tax=Microseira sp. BLCC-F43 TaxID=3153602 RepID=UPI0035B9518A